MTRLHRAVNESAAAETPAVAVGPEVRSLCGMTAMISSARMRSVMTFVERIAKSNAAVLVTGESGSGKELVARALHEYSPRSSKPWVDINCAALPDHLMESELFGYEKGAFSGADCGKQGMFELAHQGTLFLDEIGELDLKSQSKLLRVLDGYPHYRLGGTRKIAVDVRIVAATNADLENEVKLGRFRADLFHRINQVRVQVPALRERTDDIAPLAGLFLERQNSPLTLTGEAMEALKSYSWPGNIRELKNLMARMSVMVEGAQIRLEDLPAEVRQFARPTESAPSHRLDQLEQTVIFNALAQADGRRNRAAEMLGISRRTLIRRLKVYGVNQGRPLACSAATRD